MAAALENSIFEAFDDCRLLDYSNAAPKRLRRDARSTRWRDRHARQVITVRAFERDQPRLIPKGLNFHDLVHRARTSLARESPSAAAGETIGHNTVLTGLGALCRIEHIADKLVSNPVACCKFGRTRSKCIQPCLCGVKQIIEVEGVFSLFRSKRPSSFRRGSPIACGDQREVLQARKANPETHKRIASHFEPHTGTARPGL